MEALVPYSQTRHWRGVYERLNRFIDVCSRRMEIDIKANEICRPFGLSAQILPIPTTAVVGDKPDYGCMIEITGKPDYETLARLSNRICNEIDGITRVVYRLA